MNDKVAVFAGLDYHRRFTQVCIVDQAGGVLCNRRVPSDTVTIAATIARHGHPKLVAIESCSGAAQLAHDLIEAFGLPARLTHPGYVNRMRHNPDKSDLSDARVLAELSRSGFLPEVWLAPEPIRELRSLVQYRVQLVQQRRQAKVRILALLRERRVTEPAARRWTAVWRQWLQEDAELPQTTRWIVEHQLAQLDRLHAEILQTERRLAKQTAGDRVVERLLRLPGVGPVTAWMLRADIGRFDRFRSGRQLSRYCGLSPRNASSGERVADAGLVKAGRAQLRAVLVQAAHRLVRYDERWRRLFNTLRSRGKPTCVAIAAVANRWVRWMYYRMIEPTTA